MQTLRDYQLSAMDSIEEEWKKGVRSTLACLPTGVGKGSLIAELVARNLPKRAMVIIHKRELAFQTAKRLEQFGVDCDIEMGDLVATANIFAGSPCVIASVQTLNSGETKRMHRFDPMDFSLLLLDEVHHATSSTWTTAIKHFMDGNPKMKLCGFTATPDRHDGTALKKILESVAVNIGIIDMIEAGWLVDIDQKIVRIESLKFDKVRETAGELNGADLDRLLREHENLFGVATATLDCVGEKRTLLFASTIAQAEALTAILNSHKPHCASCVSQKTEETLRKQTLKDFSEGRLQILCNVGIVGEGVDIPGVEVVVCAAPTLSRSKYAQQIGRGTRPLPGLVDPFPTPEERRGAIAGSSKPKLTVLDFTGTNATRHKLVSVADVLGGHISEEAREHCKKKIADEGEQNVREALALSEAEVKAILEAKRKAEADQFGNVKATATIQLSYVDPFDCFTKTQEKWQGFKQKHPLSLKQRQRLLKNGWDPEQHTFQENIAAHTRMISATDKQRWLMKKIGIAKEFYENPHLPVWTAATMITAKLKEREGGFQ